MSKEVLEQVVLKASSDARFRSQLTDNFEAAIRPYDLSPDEKSKLRSGIAGAIGDDREVRRTMAASHAQSSETASNQAASNEALSHQAATNEVASNEVASNEVASNEVASNEVASSEVASNEVASKLMME